MWKFNIGDRVVYTGKWEHSKPIYERIGKEGKIVSRHVEVAWGARPQENMYTIEYIEYRCRVDCFEGNLELVKREEPKWRM